jgi:ribosomal protein L16/L10AE
MKFLNNKQKYKYIFKRRKNYLVGRLNYHFLKTFNYSIFAYKQTVLYGCHLRTILNCFTKIYTRKTKLTRKMRFRKKGGENSSSTIKNILMYKNANQLYLHSKKKKALIKSYFFKRKAKNYGIFINLPKLPLSRKPLNMRMGKGKGSVKKWFIILKPTAVFLRFKYIQH